LSRPDAEPKSSTSSWAAETQGGSVASKEPAAPIVPTHTLLEANHPSSVEDTVLDIHDEASAHDRQLYKQADVWASPTPQDDVAPTETGDDASSKLERKACGDLLKDYADQFRDAVRIDMEEEDAKPRASDYVMFVFAVFWKVAFATIPPVWVFGGWARFVVSLGMIGLCTGVIADMASLLGCVAGVPDSITAITFVAFGTSLPDTFASKLAAQQDPWADASIGNVMGSNSVNVFLGIGISWSIAAIYWAASAGDQATVAAWAMQYPDAAKMFPTGGKFVVHSGSLDMSVAVFIACALVCVAVLLLRRYKAGGELGGPEKLKYCSSAFFFGLWLIYIALSIWYALTNRGPCD